MLPGRPRGRARRDSVATGRDRSGRWRSSPPEAPRRRVRSGSSWLTRLAAATGSTGGRPPGQPWQLVDWSGDKARALFENQGGSRPALHQLVLASGKVSTFRLPSASDFTLAYTRPDGANLLASEATGSPLQPGRGATGALISGSGYNAALSAPTADRSGERQHGVELVTTPAASSGGCPCRARPRSSAAARRSDGGPATAALVTCISSTAIAGPRVWLVPVSGSAPTALTAARNGGRRLRRHRRLALRQVALRPGPWCVRCAVHRAAGGWRQGRSGQRARQRRKQRGRRHFRSADAGPGVLRVHPEQFGRLVQPADQGHTGRAAGPREERRRRICGRVQPERRAASRRP